jgi:hypothetical protein
MNATHQFVLGHFWLVFLLVLIAAVFVFVLWRRAARQTFDVIRACSVALESFDAKVIDGFVVNGLGRLVNGASKGARLCDAWVIDGPVNVGARIIWALSFPVRMIQSGLVQSYMLFVVVGLIGVLGYCLYLGHHAVR